MSLTKKKGFTLVEMMMVVVTLGILTGIVTAKFGTMLRRAREGNLLSNLSLIRSSLNLYFADNLARFPVGAAGTNASTLNDTLLPKYLKSLPTCHVFPHHNEAETVDNVATADLATHDSTGDGEWAYVSVESNNDWGLIKIEAYETDSKGTIWSTY